MNNEPVAWTACLDCGKRVTGDSIHTCSPQLKTLTGVKTLADYIEQETREEMLRNQMQLLLEEINNLQKENAKLKRDVEGLMDGRC
jgi:uncharacterized protein YlxW (UPF0749 family)